MKRSGLSHATLMLLVCVLPLLVFFALALVGVQVSPFWVPLILLVCCLAMFFLTAGACGHERKALAPKPPEEEPATRPTQVVKADDVFRVHHSRQVGETVI